MGKDYSHAAMSCRIGDDRPDWKPGPRGISVMAPQVDQAHPMIDVRYPQALSS